MKDNKLLGCGGCFVLVVLIIVCVSALFLGGKTLVWSGIAFVVGAVIGSILGGGVGIASGGSATNGAGPVALIMGVVCVVVVNWYLWASDGWWKSIQPAREQIAAISTQLPTSSSQAQDLTDVSYDQIESNFQNMAESDWKSYKRKLIGVEIEWRGVVESLTDKYLGLYVGQDKLSRRIYVYATKEQLKSFQEQDFVQVHGRISEVDEILGLNIRISDATIGKDEGAD